MINLARSDQSVLGQWWWTVDRWTLALVGALMIFGLVLMQAATPAVAIAKGLGNFYFVKRHLIYLVPALAMMIGVSLLPPRGIRLLALGGLGLALLLLVATLFSGSEIKGATRWIYIAGISIQPSEFVKPLFVVVAAWLFTRHAEHRGLPAQETNIGLFLLIAMLFLLQPDFGMTFLLFCVWFLQLFLAGLSLFLAGLFAMGGLLAVVAAYFIFPHVASRIDRFLKPESGDTYQIDRSLEAFQAGGLLGTGPGEGRVKMGLPGAHTDFIFAVAGEELGLVWCLVIVAICAAIVLRGFWRLQGETSLFVVLAVSGLLFSFGLQAIINMASVLHLMPTKGMTLPFVSYGGSSLLALSLAMGLLLGLTRKRYGRSDI